MNTIQKCEKDKFRGIRYSNTSDYKVRNTQLYYKMNTVVLGEGYFNWAEGVSYYLNSIQQYDVYLTGFGS